SAQYLELLIKTVEEVRSLPIFFHSSILILPLSISLKGGWKMRMSQPRMIMPIALVAVAALVALVFAVPALTGNLEVRQTETYQLHTFDRSQYFPAEAIVTVAAPKTMYVAEGRDYVDV